MKTTETEITVAVATAVVSNQQEQQE